MKSMDVASVAAKVPLQRLLVETDAPWCSIKASSPVAALVTSSWRSVKKEKWEENATVKDRCEPCHVRAVAEALAGLNGVSVRDISVATEANVDELFFPSGA
jgi:TatD DNase family protein